MDIKEIYESIPHRYPELRGQVALVTGSARGIGKGIVLRLAREGMRVVVNSRNTAEVRATGAELRELGVEVLEHIGDVGSSRDVEALFAAVVSAFGTVDLLVNNAGTMGTPEFFKLDEARFDEIVNTNLRGPFLCARRAVDLMRERGRGSIVHISSVGGQRAHQPGSAYDATKSAIDGLTRAMGIELAEYGIRVNAVAPGAIRTERTGSWPGVDVDEQAQRIPQRRLGSTLEIAAAVAFLASDDASYIAGQVLYVDGGITAQLYPKGQFI